MRDECVRQIMKAVEDFKAVLLSFEIKQLERDERSLMEFQDILSSRTQNVLFYQLSIETVADLLEYVEQNGARSLLYNRNFGRKSLSEIYDFVEKYNAGKL